MEILREWLNQNSWPVWLGGMFWALLTLVILIFVRGRLRSIFKNRYQRTKALSDRLVKRLSDKTHWFFLLVIALYVGSQKLPIPEGLAEKWTNVVFLLGLVLVGVWGHNAILLWAERAYENKKDKDASFATALGVIKFIILLGFYAVLLLVALDNAGVDIAALVAGLGIGGIAIALAVQKILGDLFASLTIVMDKPFVIGDFIIAGADMGTVQHIGLKSTQLKSINGERLVIPNSDLLDSRIRNFRKIPERRQVFLIGVTYDTPADKLERIPGMIKEIIESQPDTRVDRIHFKQFGAYSLDFETVYWLLQGDYAFMMDTQQAINLALCRKFQAEGIEFAFPTQTIQLDQGSNPGPGPSPV
ncbi:mechanosensitive ion channel family protein [Nitrospina gracilis]|uniref:mechanosensitive ion channel family protein n=1 Tax=Nitrospina gracilis TaxID=35801 RepID=UPI001F412C7A|nr:mechanosensitive ion channel family protein [Nitrospina gracilis]MCF8720906.1 small-conductance mechanosensitive channel [Nitrospina gracilis Nb-211]